MIKNWLEIGNKHYDVIVTKISENANILYSDNTGRTMSRGARITLDPLGTFFGHKITVRRHGSNYADYDKLFNDIVKPRYDGIRVKAVHDQTTIEYDAYISTAERELKNIDKDKGVVCWREMEINIVPMEAQVLPE